ncbi:lipase family protein [Antrihabitans stalagmiti]|uniref:lipase family protein n=1 Tax=Antrihabitans stalagmiti TaxID=2799499 RepID=UPI001F2F97EA|nr:lipase family protein [Antrihabitans stalagmiti]
MNRAEFTPARRVAAATLLAATLFVGACATSDQPDPDRSASGATAAPTAPSTTPQTPPPVGAERGALTAQQPGAPTLGAASVTTIRYRSTSGVDGGGTEVSGTVFVPEGTPPPGGWPVVTVGHGTTGVGDECAPSRHDDLLGSIRLVKPLLERGYVVTVSDLQGLGTDGPHPYLEPNSAAYDLIDAVRAARILVPDASTRWAALGVSQGGQASWAAAERANDYGDGLEFVGSANLSPAADISGFVNADGNVEVTVPQQMFLPTLIAGLTVLHPELNADAYLHGELAANKDTLLACTGPAVVRKLSVAQKLSPEDSRPSTPADVDRMRGWLTELALPKVRAAGPMLVVIGEKDTVILPQWTREAVVRACELGDVVALDAQPDQAHADSRAVPPAVEWIADRFDGMPAPNTCGG